MSLLGRAAIFILKEASGPALSSLGRNIGQAVGERLGRIIDPKGAEAREKANKEAEETEDSVPDEPEPEEPDEDEDEDEETA